MASARQKARTLRHDFDQYELTLAELLAAAGISQNDIVEGDVWRVRVTGDTVVLVRHRTPVLNPSVSASPLERI